MPPKPQGPLQVAVPGPNPNLGIHGTGLHAAASQREDELLEALQQKINSIYKPGSPTAAKLFGDIVRRYRATSIVSQPKFVADMAKALDDVKLHATQLDNVLRQEKEVAKSQSNPGEIDFRTLVPEMQGLMGVDPGPRWQSLYEQYGPNFYDDFDTRQNKIDEIKDNSVPMVYTRPLHRNGALFLPGYSKLLYEARGQASESLRQSTHRLNSLIQTGRPFVPQPKKTTPQSVAWSGVKKVGGGLGTVAESAANGLRSIVDYAGRGIYSKSDPNYNKSLQRYYDHRNQTFSNLLWNLNPAQSKNSAVMERCKKILEQSRANEDGMLDEASFKQMMDLMTQEMKRMDKENSDKIDEFNRSMNNLNKQVVETAKAQTSDSDAMMKWRILQMALIMTPFMGLSVMGPVTHIFSQVFMDPAGLGHGIASLANIFPPLEWLHIDKAIEWLLCDMPIVHNVVDLASTVVGNHAVQLVLGGMVVPLALAPVTAIAVGGVYSIMRGAEEVKHHEKYRDAFKNHKEALDAEMAKISKEAGEIGKDWDPTALVNKQFEILEKLENKIALVEYGLDTAARTGDAVAFLAKVMGKDFVKKMEDYKRQAVDPATGQPVVHEMFDDEGKINRAEFMNLVSSMPTEEFFEKMLLCSGLEKRRAAGFQTTLSLADEFNQMRGDPQAVRLIESEKVKQHENFLIGLATNIGVDCSRMYGEDNPTKRKEAFAELESELKKAQVEFFKENAGKTNDEKLAQRLAPKTAPAAVSFSSLSDQKLAQKTPTLVI